MAPTTVLLLVACAIQAIAATYSGGESAAQAVGVICADDGAFSGLSEIHYLKEEMHNIRNVTIRHCITAYYGFVHSAGGELPVLAVIAGIGGERAALCTESVLASSFSLKFLVLLGTAGISPFLGGYNPLVSGGCAALHDEKLSIGSVCVGSRAAVVDCEMCTPQPEQYAPGYRPSECSRPSCTNYNDESLFGRCAYSAPPALAQDIYMKSMNYALPRMPDQLAAYAGEWWNATENAATKAGVPTSPHLFGPSQCMEMDTRQIWVGGAKDYLCREHSAQLLKKSPGEVPCYSAMESYGILSSLDAHSVSFAFIRAGSNYDYYPQSLISGSVPPRYSSNTKYTSDAAHTEFVKLGYRYAVATTNAVLLNFLHQFSG